MNWLRTAARSIFVKLGIIAQPKLVARYVSDQPAPEQIKAGVVYVVGGRDFQKWAIFRCPSDVHEIIRLSLMPNRRPRWAVKVDFFDRPSISPSVRQLEGSYAHFWVRRGDIDWCADSGKISSSE